MQESNDREFEMNAQWFHSCDEGATWGCNVNAQYQVLFDADNATCEQMRLAAAAPDLLAACEEMVASNMGQPRAVGVPALDAMRAAIARAKGVNPNVVPANSRR